MSNKIIKVLLFVLFVTTPWVASMGSIITSCSPAEGGTIVKQSDGGYKAIPNIGYTFDRWWVHYGLDYEIEMDNPRDFSDYQLISSMYADGLVYLVAYFEETIDPTWQILYTSSDGNVVTPNKTDVFGANIVSNTYQDGQGVITFDGPVKSIGEEAFLHCSSLTSITIPNSVTSIGQYAFEYCSSLTSITIPNSVTSIGVNAFLGCSSLTSINVDINNPNYSSVDGVLFNKDQTTLIQYPIGNTRSEYTILNSVTSIGEYAFFGCSSLTSVTIPNSVTSIGSSAFEDCSSLTSITIPNSVTSIGEVAFSDCSALTSMIVENGNTTYDSREGCNAIIETETNTLIAGCQNTVIPNSVKSIGNYAFCGCSSLTSFTIPNSVTSIGYSAFSDCYSLTSITIPNSVTSIGEGTFFYCSSLTSITIPEGVTSIGRYAFSYCYSLTSITIPYSVTSIGDSAFFFCSDLTSITCKATTPPTLGEYAFYYKLKTAYIPCGTKSAYEASDWASYSITSFVEEGCIDPTWQILYTSSDGNVVTPHASEVFGANIVSNEYKDGQGIITFDGLVTQVGSYAFYECSSLTSITIPNSVTSIENHAFSSCSSLTSITLPNSLKYIEWGAFMYSALTSITIPNSVKTIENNTFQNCSSLVSVILPNSITSIGNFAFGFCSALPSITLPSSVISIGSGAFSDCSSLTSINLPEGVTSIGGQAFSSCSSLASITIPNSVTSIGVETFYSCSSLTSIVVESGNTYYDSREDCNAIIETTTNTLIAGCQNTIIPNTVTIIGEGAFWGHSSLTSITIPSSVTDISDYVFLECTALTSITCKASVPPTLGEEPFDPYLTAYIPCGTKSAYEASDWASYSITFIEESCIDPTWQILYTSTDGNVVTPYISNFGANIVSNEYKDGQGIITLDGPATRIGNHTFKNCSSLKSITIPNSVTTLDMYAFESCTSLTSITIPEGVISIGEHAFYNCTALNPINLPDNLASIGDYAFYFCSALTSITLPESLTSIGKGAFADCSSLTSITIPNGITSIADAIFSDCSSLSSITLHEGVTSIGQGAFEGCTSLTSFTIPEGITKIARATFNGCSALTSITIPEGITSIDGYAFWGCSGLTYIISKPTTPPKCGNNAFWNMDNTIPVYVPCGSVDAYKWAMNWKFFKNFQSKDCCDWMTLPELQTAVGYQIGSEGQIILNSAKKSYVFKKMRITYSSTSTLENSFITIKYPDSGTKALEFTFYKDYQYRINGTGSFYNYLNNKGTHISGNTYEYDLNTICNTSGKYFYVEMWQENFIPGQVQICVEKICTITTSATNGTVTGGGEYNINLKATLTATPNECYRFSKWSDGNTDNPRIVTVNGDATYTAEFVADQFTITVQSDNNSQGTVSVEKNL